MSGLQEDIMSWGLVDIIRPRSSGSPVNGHVVLQRPTIEIDYEKARHLVHQIKYPTGGQNVIAEPCAAKVES